MSMLGVALLWGSMAGAEPQPAASSPEPRSVVVDPGTGNLEQRLADVEARLAALEATAATRQDETADEREPLMRASPVVVEAGQVVSEAVSLTGPVEVYGHVRGNAVALAADVHVHAGGRVDGDAVAIGGRVRVEEGGVVVGDRVAMGELEAPGPSTGAVIGGRGGLEGTGRIAQAALVGQFRELARRVALIMGLVAAGVLVVGFWPRQVDRVVTLLVRRPLWHAFVGAVLTTVLGLGAGVLGITIIGLPVSLLLLLALSAGVILGFVGIGQAIGDRFPRARQHGGYAPFLVGAGLLAAVALLPWVGPAMLGALALPAVGAGLVGPFRGARGG